MLAPDIKETFRRKANVLDATPGVCVNLASEFEVQHSNLTQGFHGERRVRGDANNVSYDVHWFLKKLVCPVRVAILLKGWGERDVATVVTDISGIFWDECDYPRLDMASRPAIITKLLRGGIVWGSFVLAIAEVPHDTELMEKEDPTFSIFTELVKTWAVI